jgi:hypothetical protein
MNLTGLTKWLPKTSLIATAIFLMVVRLLGLDEEAVKRGSEGASLPFRNSASITAWARGHIKLALELGLIDEGHVFQANKAASRMYVTSLMVLALAIDPSEYDGDVLQFTDLQSLTDEEKLQLAVAVTLHLAKSHADKTFKPQQPVKRGKWQPF